MAVQWSWYVNRNRSVPDGVRPLDTPKVPDHFWEKLIKLVPVGAVALYTAADAFARMPSGTTQYVALIAIFAVGLLFVWFEMTRTRKLAWRDALGRRQILIALAAYVVWVFAQGGWFEQTCVAGVCYEPWAAGLLTVVFAAFIGFWQPEEPAPAPSPTPPAPTPPPAPDTAT